MTAGKNEFIRKLNSNFRDKKIKNELMYSLDKASEMYDDFLETFWDILFEYGKLQIIGLGTFEIKTRKAKKGLNPKTGEPVEIPERKYLKFSVPKKVRDMVKDMFKR
jgi:DNA-binding protein HU-beta